MKFFNVSLLMLSSIVAGCTQSHDSPTSKNNQSLTNSSTSSTEEFHSKLPANAPAVKVVTTGTMSPFTIQDNYGNLAGFDIDVIRAIGEAEGFKVDFIKQPWQKIFTAVEDDKADMALSSISYNPERAAKYNLSKSYFYNPSAIMYKNPQLNIKGIADLKGLRVGGMQGTKQLETVRQAHVTDKITETPSTYLLYQNLVNDKVDAIVQDYPLLKDTANHHPEYKVSIVPYEGRNDPSSQQVIVMKKGNDKLLQQVNEGIDKIIANGEMKKIQDKWKVSVEDGFSDNTPNTSAPSTKSVTASATK